LIVNDVVDESPAARAGVRKNDILIEANSVSLNSNETLIEQIQKSEGKEIKLWLLRAGKFLTLTVKPEQRTVTLADATTTKLGDGLSVLLDGGTQSFTLAPQLGRWMADLNAKNSNHVDGTNAMTRIDDIVKNPYRVDAADIALSPVQPKVFQAPSDGFRHAPSMVNGIPYTTSIPATTAGIEAEIKAVSGKVDDLSKVIDELRKTINELNKNGAASKNEE